LHFSETAGRGSFVCELLPVKSASNCTGFCCTVFLYARWCSSSYRVQIQLPVAAAEALNHLLDKCSKEIPAMQHGKGAAFNLCTSLHWSPVFRTVQRLSAPIYPEMACKRGNLLSARKNPLGNGVWLRQAGEWEFVICALAKVNRSCARTASYSSWNSYRSLQHNSIGQKVKRIPKW